MLSTKSIRFFVAVKTAPWIALFLFCAGSVIIYIEKSIFTEQLNISHQKRLEHFTENQNRVLDGFLGQVNSIAANELVVNGLADIGADSQRYLKALISSYSLAGTAGNSIKVVDFKGNTIVTNGIEISGIRPDALSIFDGVINNSMSDYQYTSTGIVFVSPVFFSSSVAGAILVELPYRDLNELLSVDIIDGEIIALDENKNTIFSSNDEISENFLGNNKLNNKGYIVEYEKIGSWYYRQFSLDNGHVVYSLEKSESLFSKLYWFVLLGFVSLIIAFLGALISIFLSSSIISKTLNNLLLSLQFRTGGSSVGGNYLGDNNDPEELVKIYQNFNNLISDLTRSESFGNDIQSIINSLTEYLVVFDLEGKVSLSNRSFKNFNKSFIGDSDIFLKVIPKVLQSSALSTEKPMQDFECVYTVFGGFKSGDEGVKKEVIIRWSRSLYLTPSNAIDGLTFIGVDVTEAKSIEKDIEEKNKAIQHLSQRFSMALESALIGVWEFKAEENILIWDDRMHAIYQVDKKDFTGSINDWIACVHPQDFEKTNELLQKSLLTGENFFSVFRIIWPNKEVRWVSANARVINDDDTLRVVGANIDITQTKRLNEELEVSLANAEELVKIKSDFLASMSHEIRTPMNGVLGMLNLLKRTSLSTQQNRYTELAHSSAESLLALINDILDFSKVDAGKLELEYIDFNLSDLLGEISESMAQRAQDKGLEIILDVTGVTTDIVSGDPGRLRQIFTNLIGNAIKFTDQGEIIIAAALAHSADDEWRLTASVKDTGIGIPEDKVDSLFDSFSQVDASTTRKYGGTGLGLAIVRQLCQLMRGDITIKSCLNKGSEFCFDLVLAQSHEDKVDDDPSLITSHGHIDLEGQSMIIIDDNDHNARVLQKQLNLWNADASIATSAQEGLERLMQASTPVPSIILIDAEMPTMSGLDFLDKLRAHRRFNGVKVVLMTPIAMSIAPERLKNRGSIGLFPKPATRKDLFNSIFSTVPATDITALQAPMPKQELITEPKPTILERPKPEQTLKPTRILLVEDNPINQEVALGVLMSLNFTADIAENGLKAISMLNDNRYDLVLMDCQMPEMDGYAATHAIRSGKTQQSDIPIIAMTANAMKGDKEKCLAAGMDDYLSKPIDPQQLLEKIGEWGASMNQQNDNQEEPAAMSSITDPHDNAIIWDRSDFMARIMNNETLAHKLVDLFKVDTPKTIKDLAQAVDVGEAQQAGLVAHKLKGTVSNLGGIELAELAFKIEQAGREDDLESIQSLLPMVKPKYDQLLTQIEKGL